MIIRYTLCPVRSPVPALGGATFMPRPLLAVRITGPAGSRLRDGLLDTGADETVLDPSEAPQIGVDLSRAVEREVNLVGRGRSRRRYPPVLVSINHGVDEIYEVD